MKIGLFSSKHKFSMDRKINKKKFTKQSILVYVIGLAIIFITVYNIIDSDSPKKMNIEADHIMISSVEEGLFQEYTPVTGSIQPLETFQLDVSNGGRILKKFVDEGAYLKVGDPIILLDNVQLRLNIIYNEANVFQQINNLRSTRLSFQQSKLDLQSRLLVNNRDLREQNRLYKTNKRLFSKGMISENEYLDSKDQYEFLVKQKELMMETYRADSAMRAQQIIQLEKSVNTLEANLEITKQQLNNLTVRAPITGQLTSLNAEIGQSIGAGENIGQIDKVDSFKVKASIDEYWIARVRKGQKGSIAFNSEEYELVVKTVFPQVTNGSFQVDMLFVREVPERIRRGQTVRIKLELGELNETVYINRGGFFQNTGGRWIFVVDSSGKYASKRNIRLGRQNNQSFEVLEGLKKGEKVITSSYDNFGDAEKLEFN